MAIPRQGCIQDINNDLPDDLSTDPPPLPQRKPLTTPERFSEEQHRNGKSNPRLPETLNLMTFPNDDEDTNDLTASWVCTGNSFDSAISECPLLNLSHSSETDEIHDKIYSGLETNMSDSLDKYFIGDLFKKCFDLDSETRPRLYTPDFSTCIKGIDAVKSANSVDLPTLPGEKQNQSDGLEVVDSTKSITHLTNTPSQSSKPNAMKLDSTRSKRSSLILKGCFRENSLYTFDPMNPTITVENIQDSDTESEEQDHSWHTPKPRQQDMYLEKLRELEQEVNQLQQLQKDISTTEPGLLNIQIPKLSSQRSVSDSDIYNSIELENKIEGRDINDKLNVIKSDIHDMKKSSSTDNINRRTNRDRSSTLKYDQSGIKASSSFENIKTMATKLWGKITKCDKDSSDGTSQKLSIKVDARVELSCPCERSCGRVKRLVTTQGGYMWVAFIQCSWVSLYNNRHERVYKFDTRGCVDSLAVTATGVLYVSCPLQKRIIMLSSNLQMTVLCCFTKLYPRGVAVSPNDGTLIVCMASQTVGNVMKKPSKNSCLMRFKGETPNETGTIVNKGNYFGYPVKVTINMNGFLLVSDFGLRCLIVLDQRGHLLKKFSSLGGVPLWHVHALTSNPVRSFCVVQGGAGTLSITRLGEYLGTFEETSTSTKDERLVKRTVETASMKTEGQIVLASGNIITHVSLVY
ncbi:hypothetical protein KP79_PYT02989 [Mizuhopecten yessoensis]|uniref:Uncharacterized protein n=1 Tax=Mizuhopecten yessoensis TaxID=6573 RepID=A0A210PJN3_MIZYE|nr:hypothetical protein KP79_PYT02989 [Mizuhopecten yessoensis]